MYDVARIRITRQTMRDGSIRFRLRGVLDGGEESLGLYVDEDEARGQGAAWLLRHEASPDGLTLRAWGVTWLDLRETDGAHRNARGDRSRWARYVADSKLADMLVRRIERKHVVAWLDGVVRLEPVRAVTTGRDDARKTKHTPRGGRLSAQTVRHALRLLSVALSDAAERGHCPVNPAAGMKAPAIVDSPRAKWAWLTLAEIASIAALGVTAKLRREWDGSERERLTPKQRAAFLLAIYTGLREGEVWGLRWCDVRLDGPTPQVHVARSFGGPPKSKRSIRPVPLLPAAAAALLAWRELVPGIGEAPVFPADGGGVHAKGYDAGWEQVADRLGIDARFHDLRHTCASHLVQGSWTPTPLALIEVRDWMGHESIVTTQRYAHLAPGGLHAAIARTGATVTKLETRRKK